MDATASATATRGIEEIEEIDIGVDSWIIQDGNYGDFQLGGELSCAFEFHGELGATTGDTPSIARLGQNRYRVRAQLVFAGADFQVIDFGLPAYQECAALDVPMPGAWVEGEILLQIDPFMYRERFESQPGLPDIFNRWEITGIARDDTPWLAAADGKTLSRDVSRLRWTAVAQTDAWKDDDGRGAYLLHLRRVKGQPAAA